MIKLRLFKCISIITWHRFNINFSLNFPIIIAQIHFLLKKKSQISKYMYNVSQNDPSFRGLPFNHTIWSLLPQLTLILICLPIIYWNNDYSLLSAKWLVQHNNISCFHWTNKRDQCQVDILHLLRTPLVRSLLTFRHSQKVLSVL